MSEKIIFKMPDGVSQSDMKCPECGVRMYNISSHEEPVCGQCDLIDAHEKKEKEIREHYKHSDPLGSYNKEKAEKAKKRAEKKKADYKARAYKD